MYKESDSKKDNNNNNNESMVVDYYMIYLFENEQSYTIFIQIRNNHIIIKYDNYLISLDKNDISLLTKNNFETIEDAYEYIEDRFSFADTTKNIINNKEMKITMNLDLENKERIELLLLYNKNEEKNLYIKNVISDSYIPDYGLVNTFEAFKTLDDKLYIVYTDNNCSILCYDLLSEKLDTEIKNESPEWITNIKHYCDMQNKRDIIMTIYSLDDMIKLWNVQKWEFFLNIKNINNGGTIHSGNFLFENNQIFIITSNNNLKGKSQPIKVFDLKGNKIKVIKNSCEGTLFIDSFYDNKNKITYIITCNKNYVISYDYNKNVLYHKYYDEANNENEKMDHSNDEFDDENGVNEYEKKKYHHSASIVNNGEIIKLVESCYDGTVRIWNFHTGLLLNKIKVGNVALDVCLWNKDYVFVGGVSSIIIINLNNGKIIKELKEHDNEENEEDKYITSIKKFQHPLYGDCLLFQKGGKLIHFCKNVI